MVTTILAEPAAKLAEFALGYKQLLNLIKHCCSASLRSKSKAGTTHRCCQYCNETVLLFMFVLTAKHVHGRYPDAANSMEQNQWVSKNVQKSLGLNYGTSLGSNSTRVKNCTFKLSLSKNVVRVEYDKENFVDEFGNGCERWPGTNLSPPNASRRSLRPEREGASDNPYRTHTFSTMNTCRTM